MTWPAGGCRSSVELYASFFSLFFLHIFSPSCPQHSLMKRSIEWESNRCDSRASANLKACLSFLAFTSLVPVWILIPFSSRHGAACFLSLSLSFSSPSFLRFGCVCVCVFVIYVSSTRLGLDLCASYLLRDFVLMPSRRCESEEPGRIWTRTKRLTPVPGCRFPHITL